MLQEELRDRKIRISLRVFSPNDLATQWEVKAIIENPDIFDNFFEKYPLDEIKNFDDYYLYIMSLKLKSFSQVIPILPQEEHKIKIKISALSDAAAETVQAINPRSVIKYINENISEIFENDVSNYDIRSVTLDLIAKYNTGISKETFSYLSSKFGHLIIEQFDSFEIVFERQPDLFQKLFPSGNLCDIDPYRFEKVLNIWQHIMLKGNSDLKNTVSNYIPTLFADVVSLASSATIDNAIQIEETVRFFLQFLLRVRSPLASELSQYKKEIDALLSEAIAERGQSIKYKIPVSELVQCWKAIANREMRLLSITHDLTEVNGQFSAVSKLDRKPQPQHSLMDLGNANTPTNDYFTITHQLELERRDSFETGQIIGILSESETANDFYSLLLSSIKFISGEMHAECEKLECDAELLITMVQLAVGNDNSDEKAAHSLCYGASMFICAFTEKLLRLFYMGIVKDNLYVPINKATLGELLKENNTEMIKIFGLDHIKNLSFFLMQTSPDNVGHNIRNNLAHWANISADSLTLPYVARLLWLFTDILNTVFYYFFSGTAKDN